MGTGAVAVRVAHPPDPGIKVEEVEVKDVDVEGAEVDVEGVEVEGVEVEVEVDVEDEVEDEVDVEGVEVEVGVVESGTRKVVVIVDVVLGPGGLVGAVVGSNPGGALSGVVDDVVVEVPSTEVVASSGGGATNVAVKNEGR
jgi:hypothetical protein